MDQLLNSSVLQMNKTDQQHHITCHALKKKTLTVVYCMIN